MAKKVKKRKAQKPPREFTRRQLSRWQQQKRRQRIIFGAGIFIIAAVIVIVAVGLYAGWYRPLHQTAIRVNETEFNMKYYIDMLKFRGEGQGAEYISYMADSIVTEIEQNELIRQGALKLGTSVGDDEVKEELKKLDLPVNDASRDLVRTQIFIEKLRDEYFEHQVPVSAEQAHIMAMLLESESQALEVRAGLENGESFTELAGELSLNYLTRTNEGDLDWHPESIFIELLGTSIPVEFAFGSEGGALSQPLYDEEITKGVGYWLIEVLERDEDMEEAHVQAMLLGSEEEAKEIKARLEASDNFTALAKEHSQLIGAEENEGVLGLVMPDEMTPAFDEFVFNPDTELKTPSEPIRDDAVSTKGGYWLIKILDKDDDRQIDESDRDILKAKALNEWVSSLWDDPSNVVDDSFLDDEKKELAIRQATGG